MNGYEVTQVIVDTPVKVIPDVKLHILEDGCDFFMAKDIEEYPPKHDHIRQKTMDLKLERTDNCRIRNIFQKSICKVCGEEKWEEVE